MKHSLLYAGLITVTAFSLQACSGTKTSNPEPPQASLDERFDSYYGHGNRQHNKTVDQARHVVVSTKSASQRSPFRRNAPTRYVVKKGDTLWAISKKFLRNPGYWPEIWDKNQKVRNPHLIFPGDILYIHTTPAKKGSRIARAGTRVKKLVPTIRISRKGAGEPISTLRQFMTWPMIVSKSDLTSAPYVVTGQNTSLLLEAGNKIYVKGLPNAREGDSYAVYHAGDTLIDPDTKTLIGHEINYHGQVRITRTDEISTAIIEKVNRAIRPGDRLIKVDNRASDLSMPILQPTHKVRGSVVSLHEASLISAQHMIVTINLGRQQGIRKGHVLGVYTPPRRANDPYDTYKTRWHTEEKVKQDLPPEKIASMIIYKVENNISYGLLNRSEHAVKRGYKIGNP